MPEHGVATIQDADVLIWAAGQIFEAANHGLFTSRFLRFTRYQMLFAIDRATGPGGSRFGLGFSGYAANFGMALSISRENGVVCTSTTNERCAQSIAKFCRDRVLRVPATNDPCDGKPSRTPASDRKPGFFLFAANRRMPAGSPRSTMRNSPFSGTSVT